MDGRRYAACSLLTCIMPHYVVHPGQCLWAGCWRKLAALQDEVGVQNSSPVSSVGLCRCRQSWCLVGRDIAEICRTSVNQHAAVLVEQADMDGSCFPEAMHPTGLIGNTQSIACHRLPCFLVTDSVTLLTHCMHICRVPKVCLDRGRPRLDLDTSSSVFRGHLMLKNSRYI